jgi:tRNA dimethylallyltransferase
VRQAPSCRPIVILGPTAAGKSATAVEAALRLRGEVISADSRAFFRGLDIVTDKPSPDLRARVPHHLIDIVEPTGAYDAMAFRNDVERVIPQIAARGAVPILAGGGTLYLGAVLRGIFVGPSADPDLRRRLLDEPLPRLYERLQEVDPPAAARIHENDRVRIVRALEVRILTGRPISVLQQEAEPLPYRFVRFGLWRERDDHRRAIAQRVQEMLRRGLVAEVERLRRAGLRPEHQAYRTIGVRETWSYLDGKLSKAQLTERITRNSWALARRQLTWFRREESVHWIPVTDRSAAAVASEIVARASARRPDRPRPLP